VLRNLDDDLVKLEVAVVEIVPRALVGRHLAPALADVP
jgi:hypothetical protein